VGLTHFPHGVSSFGIPVIGSDLSVPNLSGNVWFVDATNGNDGNDGQTPGSAFKTIARAHTMAKSGSGDTIFVFPGSYAESLTITKDYISLIGATLAGYGKPDIEAASGVTLTVTGQGFKARHCRFAGVSNVVVQTGNGFRYTDCVFDGDGNGATTALLRLTPSATLTNRTASEGVVEDCLFRGSGGYGVSFDTSNLNGGSTDNLFQRCEFRHNTGVSVSANKTGAAGTYSLQYTNFIDCFFEEYHKTLFIDITTNMDGSAASQIANFLNCYFASAVMTKNTTVKINSTHISFVGCYIETGLVDGTTLI